MNGDIDTFEALQWYYARKENAALVALAHWDAVLLQKEYKLTREDIKAAEALQEWVEKETDSLINLAEGILAEVCKESGAVKEHKPKPNRRRRNECELPVLPKGAWAKKKKREHGEIGATLWRDTAGRPALILWVFLPKGECFNQIKDGSSDDLFLLFGHRASRVLDQVPLRKKGGGGKVKVGGVFKSRQEIEQDFRARAKQALLHSGKGKKNLLQRLAAAASSK